MWIITYPDCFLPFPRWSDRYSHMLRWFLAQLVHMKTAPDQYRSVDLTRSNYYLASASGNFRSHPRYYYQLRYRTELILVGSFLNTKTSWIVSMVLSEGEQAFFESTGRRQTKNPAPHCDAAACDVRYACSFYHDDQADWTASHAPLAGTLTHGPTHRRSDDLVL